MVTTIWKNIYMVISVSGNIYIYIILLRGASCPLLININSYFITVIIRLYTNNEYAGKYECTLFTSCSFDIRIPYCVAIHSYASTVWYTGPTLYYSWASTVLYTGPTLHYSWASMVLYTGPTLRYSWASMVLYTGPALHYSWAAGTVPNSTASMAGHSGGQHRQHGRALWWTAPPVWPGTVVDSTASMAGHCGGQYSQYGWALWWTVPPVWSGTVVDSTASIAGYCAGQYSQYGRALCWAVQPARSCDWTHGSTVMLPRSWKQALGLA